MKSVLALAALGAAFLATSAQAQQNMTICNGQVEVVAFVSQPATATTSPRYGIRLRNLTARNLLVFFSTGAAPADIQLTRYLQAQLPLEGNGQFEGVLAYSTVPGQRQMTVPEMVTYTSGPNTRCVPR